MKIDEIRELIQLMKENRIGEIDIESEGERLRLKALQPAGPAGPAALGSAAVPMIPALPAALPAAGREAAVEPETGEPINSPIVGIFYSAPGPDKPPFVQPGDEVEEGTVVCIIEAMKVMNEIKAEMRGKVRAVCVENGQPVEYGQKLFFVDPS
jgi:acetyl-CoA carboxylase biotin carboxyl carrier protein